MSGALYCMSISGIAWLHIQDVDDLRVFTSRWTENVLDETSAGWTTSRSPGWFYCCKFSLSSLGYLYVQVRNSQRSLKTSRSVFCVAAVERPATEGRGQPETQKVHLLHQLILKIKLVNDASVYTGPHKVTKTAVATKYLNKLFACQI